MTLPQTYSMREVCAALGCSELQITRLIAAGKVGYTLGSRRSRRFSAANVGQITAALEVTAAPPDDVWAQIGVTPRAAARRRRAS